MKKIFLYIIIVILLKDSQYRYSKNNLLEFPQKYSLTEFEGKKFLIDYKNERLNKEECEKVQRELRNLGYLK